MTDAVLYEVTGRVAVITLNRPERRNALSQEVRAGLYDAWARFDADKTAHVAVLTGAGDRAFCAGMDLKEASANALKIPPRDFFPVLGESVNVGKPTIAAINGAAIAGGWLIAQGCDLCIAAEHATFAVSEAKVGRGTPWASPLIHMLPQRVLMEMLLTGDPFTAQRLCDLGFVNRVIPGDKLLSESIAMGERIAANAPLTVRACRDLVYAATELGRSAARRRGDQLFEPVYLSDDAQEGPRAFAEKRAPVWKGR